MIFWKNFEGWAEGKAKARNPEYGVGAFAPYKALVGTCEAP